MEVYIKEVRKGHFQILGKESNIPLGKRIHGCVCALEFCNVVTAKCYVELETRLKLVKE